MIDLKMNENDLRLRLSNYFFRIKRKEKNYDWMIKN